MRTVRVTLMSLLVGLLLLAGQTASEASTTVRTSCDGYQVQRCVWLNYDSTNDRLRAYGRTVDAAGGNNYDVSVNQLSLQAWNGSRWVTQAYNADYDGWFANSDNASTGLVSCSVASSFRVVAFHQWRGTPSGSETRVTATFNC